MNLQDSVNDGYNFAIALHNMALVYQKLAEYPKALNYETRSYGLAKKNKDGLGQISSLKGMAAIYEDMGMQRKSLSYFLQSAELAEESGARYYLIDIYSRIAALYAGLNDYENAFVFNEKYTALKDSIMTDERDKAMGKVRDFQDEKTQHEIEILTKDSEIQKITVKRQKIIRNSILSVGILILLLALGLLHRYRYVRKTRNELSVRNVLINKEKDRSDALLLNILPAETAEELKTHGRSEARHFEMVTVMFTDFKGFTQLAEKLTPQQLVDEIDYCFRQFDHIITKHNIEKIKTIGDAYMCASGLPVTTDSHAVDMVKAALDIQAFMQKLGKERKAEGRPLFEVRIGIHSGPVIAGIVGTKKFQYDIWGDTVNIAARMESSGEAGKINISQTTYERIKHLFECSHRGKIEAKNKGFVDMYFVENLII
jgi:class 3 adenylate cyclase